MNDRDEQNKIIEAVKPYIGALGDVVTNLPGDVGCSGFIFEPNVGLAMHFGNIIFPDPESLVVLHNFLSCAIAELLRRGQSDCNLLMPDVNIPGVYQGPNFTPEAAEAAQRKERPGYIRDFRDGGNNPNKPDVSACLNLADLLAKMILMCPMDSVPTDVVDAARHYSSTRTNS